jgi:two-component system sensor histidine kinase PilS (NtrC family)
VSGPDAVADAETGRQLRQLAWARLIVAHLVLALTPLLAPDLAGGVHRALLAAALLAAVGSSAVLLVTGPPARPGRVAALLCLLDAVLITAVVAATGGPRSVFPFLYVLTVTAACVLLPRAGALLVAATGSTLYTGVVVAATVLPLTLLFEPPAETAALEVLTMFLNAGTFCAVAILAGGLGEQHRAARRELARRGRDLHELQAFTSVVLQSLGAGLIVLDRTHTVAGLNRAAEAITGHRAPEILGEPWSRLAGDAVSLDAVDAAIAGAPAVAARREVDLRRADGRAVPVRLAFSALQAHDGRRLGWIVLCEDLSEVRAMEDRLQQADRLATLGRMAANLAHELRNPLAALTGAAEMLHRAGGGPDEREHLARIVAVESERLDRVVANFLDYARPAPIALERADVADVLDDVLARVEHGDPPAGVKVVRAFDRPLPWPVDVQHLRQALWNLCLNAVEAMPEGGELRVAAAVRDEGLRIEVADTGPGLGTADPGRIFEPFYSTKPGGRGLGLALVHRIISDHGGDITVTSGPAGTTAAISLPRRPPEARR